MTYNGSHPGGTVIKPPDIFKGGVFFLHPTILDEMEEFLG